MLGQEGMPVAPEEKVPSDGRRACRPKQLPDIGVSLSGDEALRSPSSFIAMADLSLSEAALLRELRHELEWRFDLVHRKLNELLSLSSGRGSLKCLKEESCALRREDLWRRAAPVDALMASRWPPEEEVSASMLEAVARTLSNDSGKPGVRFSFEQDATSPHFNLSAKLADVIDDKPVVVLAPTEENLRLLSESLEGTGERRHWEQDVFSEGGTSGAAFQSEQAELESAPDSNRADDGVDEDATQNPSFRRENGNSVRSGMTTARHRRNIGKWSVCVWKFLEDPDSSAAAAMYGCFHTCFVAAGVSILVLQTVDSSPAFGLQAAVLDLAFDCLLVVELAVRFTVCPMTHSRFFKDPFNILDIVSTAVPLFVRAAAGIVMDTTRLYDDPPEIGVFILFCVVPTLRLMKLLRRFQKYQLLTQALWMILEALPVLIYTLVLFILMFSSVIYYFEPRSNILSVPHSWWFVMVTMTTVGYGDTTPHTLVGYCVTCILMVIAALYMAMPIGIVGQAFNQVWSDRDRILLMKKTRYKIQEWGYNAHDIPALFRQFDVDCSGELDIEEFRQMITEMSIGLSDQRIVELFESIDGDGSGAIDDKEFIRCLFPHLYHQLCREEEEGQQAQRDSVVEDSMFPLAASTVGRILIKGWSTSSVRASIATG